MTIPMTGRFISFRYRIKCVRVVHLAELSSTILMAIIRDSLNRMNELNGRMKWLHIGQKWIDA